MATPDPSHSASPSDGGDSQGVLPPARRPLRPATPDTSPPPEFPLAALNHRFPRPGTSYTGSDLDRRMKELGSGWSEEHKEFWEAFAESAGSNPQLFNEGCAYLARGMAASTAAKVPELDDLVRPFLILAYYWNRTEMQEGVLQAIAASQQEFPDTIPLTFAARCVDHFETDLLELLDYHGPFAAMFELERARVVSLFQPRSPNPEADEAQEVNDSPGPEIPEEFNEDQETEIAVFARVMESVTSARPGDGSSFADLKLREQLEDLADSCGMVGTFFLSMCCAGAEMKQHTIEFLLDRWVSGDKPVRRAAGGLLYYLLAESTETHRTFVDQCGALLAECDSRAVPRLARLVGVAGKIGSGGFGDEPLFDGSEGGSLGLVESSSVQLFERVTALCAKLISSSQAERRANGILFLAHLSTVDPDYCFPQLDLTLRLLDSLEGVRLLQGTAEREGIYAEALSLAGIPRACIARLIEEEGRSAEWDEEIAHLARMVLMRAERSFDLTARQFTQESFRASDIVRSWMIGTVVDGLVAARNRSPEQELEYLCETLSACVEEVGLNVMLRWPNNDGGLECCCATVHSLLDQADELVTDPLVAKPAQGILLRLHDLYDKVVLTIQQERRSPQMEESSGSPEEMPTDEEVLERLPEATRELFLFLEERSSMWRDCAG